MNYIKDLEQQLKATKKALESLGESIRDLEGYLLSPKFHEDTTVQVKDVLTRLSEARSTALAKFDDASIGNKRWSVAKLITGINQWLDDPWRTRRGDAKVYTQAEWRKRGELYGNEAVCTLVIDGSPLYELFNYGTDKWAALTLFQQMLENAGYRMEQGYAWTVHIYEKEN